LFIKTSISNKKTDKNPFFVIFALLLHLVLVMTVKPLYIVASIKKSTEKSHKTQKKNAKNFNLNETSTLAFDVIKKE